MKSIDLTTWSRRSQYAFFREIASPHFGMTAAVDVTRLVELEKPKGVSLFNGVLFNIMRVMNAFPEWRTRFRGNQVVEHDVVHPSVTVPIEDEQFGFCDMVFSPDWPTFDAACREAVAAANQQTELTDQVADLDDRIYLTCVPWSFFTGLTHPTDGRDDCIPRIAWGKIERQGDQWRMPVAVQVHHAVVDGRHVGQFFTMLEAALSESLT